MPTVNSIALALMKERGDATDNSDGQVSVIEGRVNDAMDEIAVQTGFNLFHTRTTIPTVIGQAVYNLPVGAKEVIQMRYLDDSSPLPMLTIQEAGRRRLRLEDQGRSLVWIEDGSTIVGSDTLLKFRLWPVPSLIISIEVEYYFFPADVASSALIPVQGNLLTAIKYHVRAAMAVNEERFDEAQYYRTVFAQILDRLIKQEQTKPALKVILREVDLSNIRRKRGPKLPGNFPDIGFGW